MVIPGWGGESVIPELDADIADLLANTDANDERQSRKDVIEHRGVEQQPCNGWRVKHQSTR